MAFQHRPQVANPGWQTPHDSSPSTAGKCTVKGGDAGQALQDVTTMVSAASRGNRVYKMLPPASAAAEAKMEKRKKQKIRWNSQSSSLNIALRLWLVNRGSVDQNWFLWLWVKTRDWRKMMGKQTRGRFPRHHAPRVWNHCPDFVQRIPASVYRSTVATSPGTEREAFPTL